jgi:hypothetical protein
VWLSKRQRSQRACLLVDSSQVLKSARAEACSRNRASAGLVYEHPSGVSFSLWCFESVTHFAGVTHIGSVSLTGTMVCYAVLCADPPDVSGYWQQPGVLSSSSSCVSGPGGYERRPRLQEAAGFCAGSMLTVCAGSKLRESVQAAC